MWKVKLTYFKPSGKYYSEGEYLSEKVATYEIHAEVEEMLRSRKRPGLVDGDDCFYVLISVPDHPGDLPHLYIPSA